jgi:ribosomal protein L44E
LKVESRARHHLAHFLASDVAQFMKPSRRIDQLRFKCSECEGKDCSVIRMEIDRDRRPDIVVWRPMRLR